MKLLPLIIISKPKCKILNSAMNCQSLSVYGFLLSGLIAAGINLLNGTQIFD